MRVHTRVAVRATAVAVALTALTTACSSKADFAGANANGKATFAASALKGNGQKIVLFTYAPGNKYISVYTDTLKSELRSMGYKLQIFTNTFSQSQENQQVQQYLASGEKPALFLWVPFDDKGGINSTRLLSRVAPVIQLNAPLLPDGEKYVVAFSGDNQYEQGRLMGQIMMDARSKALAAGRKLHSEGGTMLVFQGSADNAGSKDRFRGFTDETKSDPFTVLDTTYNLTPDDAYKNGLTVIPKYKSRGIDFVWVYTDTTALGVIKAMQQSGLTPGKDVDVVGGNCGDPAQLLNGDEYGTTLQVAYVEGMSAAFTSLQYLASGGKVLPGSTTYPATATLPSVPPTAPHKFNYIPLRTVIGPQQVKSVKLWGKPVTELCVG